MTWAEFNTKCYDSPPDGVALTAAPAASNVQVQVPSAGAEATYNFCINSVTISL